MATSVSTHADLITSLAFSPLAPHALATSSLDAHVRIYARATPAPESNGTLPSPASAPFTEIESFKAHDGPVLKVAWGDGEWGHLLASAGADGSVRLWDRVPPLGTNGRWIQRAVLNEARGSVRDIAFAPTGLRLAAIGADSVLRVYECPSPDDGYTLQGGIASGGLASWTHLEELDLNQIPFSPTNHAAHTAGVDAAGNSSISLAASSLPSSSMRQIGPSPSGASVAPSSIGVSSTSSAGNRPLGPETEGGWSLSWCKEAWWGPVLAVAAGPIGNIRLFSFATPSQWSQAAILAPPPTSRAAPITSLDWAPGNGRSYQLLAAGSRDGLVRIWKLAPPETAADAWMGTLESELTDHVGGGGLSRVEWNVTGTVLSTAGDDGNVRLWKATYAGEWRTAAVVSCEPDQDKV